MGDEQATSGITADEVFRTLIGDGYVEDATGNNVFLLSQKGALLLAFCMDTMTVGEMAEAASAALSDSALPWRIAPIKTPLIDGLKKGRSAR